MPVIMEKEKFKELFPKDMDSKGMDPNGMDPKGMDQKGMDQKGMDQKGMECYKNRLNTFMTKEWKGEISMKDMAVAGFCCTGTTDEVVCYECRGVISNWSEFEVPSRLHKKIYPGCDFVIKLSENEIKKRTQFDSPQKEADSGETSNEEDAMEFFWSEFNRLMSFEKWPLSSPVDRYDLAATGFYCLDGTSTVMCVGCGKEVSDWKLGDRPKEKHQDVDGMSCPFATNQGSEEEDMDEVEIQQFIRRCISTKK
ncbi:baculoviral IAP repeat-containing protein 2 [Apostichopus japonicus]|uniref:Baculoviral IAP repeat-containing protein 2 n=1 Tax=Stichopus japonicus TaxID=307972 RepID=A0A2G8LMZ6_STIJA|nr:baculoviral IAP repeat-containing protein 2 [Apostichopus japonicus]